MTVAAFGDFILRFLAAVEMINWMVFIIYSPTILKVGKRFSKQNGNDQLCYDITCGLFNYSELKLFSNI